MKTSNLVSNQWLTDTHQTTIYKGILGAGGRLLLFRINLEEIKSKAIKKRKQVTLHFSW